MIGKVIASLLISSFFVFETNSQTIDLSSLNADVETGTDAGTGLTIEIMDSVSNKCEDYVLDKGWNTGENTKKNGSKYYIGIGESAILAPTGSENIKTCQVLIMFDHYLDKKLYKCIFYLSQKNFLI